MPGPFDQLFTRGQAPLPQMPEPMDTAALQQRSSKLPGFWESLKAGLIEELTGREERRNRRDLTDVSMRNASVNENQDARADKYLAGVHLPQEQRAQAKFGHETQDRQTLQLALERLGAVNPAARDAALTGTKEDAFLTDEQRNQRALQDAHRAATASTVGFTGQSGLPVIGGVKPIGEFAQKKQIDDMATANDARLSAQQHQQGMARDAASPPTQRAPTGADRQAVAYYNRLQSAIGDMDAMEGALTNKDLALINNLPVPDLLKNPALSRAGQAYAQALAIYTEARLRKESGAAIPESEYEMDRRAIARAVGDTPETVAQKKKSRDLIADGMAFSSGRAYDEYYGTPYQPKGRPAEGAYTGEVRQTADGRFIGQVNGQTVTLVKTGDGWTVKK
jgi:hypothetical protein